MVPFVPFAVRPLQPALVQPFHRPGWVYEEKIDGWRIVAYKTGRAGRLISRKGIDHTARFPELARAIGALPGAAACRRPRDPRTDRGRRGAGLRGQAAGQ